MNLRRTYDERTPRLLTAAFAIAALAIGGLTGCGGSSALPGAEALAEVEPGTPKDTVMELFAAGEIQATRQADAGRLLNGYRVDRYFVEGATLEVVWLHREGSGGEHASAREDLMPVVFRNDALDGWGWDHFDDWVERQGLSSPESAAS